MLCEDCGRNRAVVHITQIGPDGKIEKNLCERCAAKYGEFLMENQKHRNVSMNDFLKGVFSAGAQRLLRDVPPPARAAIAPHPRVEHAQRQDPAPHGRHAYDEAHDREPAQFAQGVRRAGRV